MPGKQVTFDTVRAVARELLEVEDCAAYGSPALKVRGKLMACIAINKSAEPGSLAVRIDKERRAELLEGAPDVYYVTDHYVNYPMVLVRMARIDAGALKDLLGMARRFVTTQESKASLRSAAGKGSPGSRSKTRRAPSSRDSRS